MYAILKLILFRYFFFFSSRRRHTRLQGDWSSDVCSSDLRGDRGDEAAAQRAGGGERGRDQPRGAAAREARQERFEPAAISGTSHQGGRLAMTKSELIARLAQRYPQLVAKDAEYAVKMILDAMTQALLAGNRIEIRGFASVGLNYRPPRTGRNPKSGEKVQVPEKYVPHFKAGKELRERVDGATPEAPAAPPQRASQPVR